MDSLSAADKNSLSAKVEEIPETDSPDKKDSPTTTSIIETSSRPNDNEIQNAEETKSTNDNIPADSENKDSVKALKGPSNQAGNFGDFELSTQELVEISGSIAKSKESSKGMDLAKEAVIDQASSTGHAGDNSDFNHIQKHSSSLCENKETEGSFELSDNAEKTVANDTHNKEISEEMSMDVVDENESVMYVSQNADSTTLNSENRIPSSSNDDQVEADSKVPNQVLLQNGAANKEPFYQSTSEMEQRSQMEETSHKESSSQIKLSSPKGPSSQIGWVEVKIKDEPVDTGYERRLPSTAFDSMRPIVVYSDSSSDSDDSSTEDSFSVSTDGGVKPSSGYFTISGDEADLSVDEGERTCRTRGEVLPEDLPMIKYLSVAPEEEVEMEPLGKVTGIVDILVVIKANPLTPALYDDTVLFSETRQPLGLVFETFGTVEQPHYTIRFNTNADIVNKGIQIGDVICYAPKADNLTKYVFLKELQKMKFDDASWEHDNEPPMNAREYSDDEEERRVKKKNKNKNRRNETDASGAPLSKRAARRRRKNQSNGDSKDGLVLLQGDLNRNPFGNSPRRQFVDGGSNCPPSGSGGMPPPSRPPPRNEMFHRPQPPPPPHNFGGPPRWPMRPGFHNQGPPFPNQGRPFPNQGPPFPNQGPSPDHMHRPFFQTQGPMPPPRFQHFQPPPNFNPGPGHNNRFGPPGPFHRPPSDQNQSNGQPPWLPPPVFNSNVPPPHFGSPPPPH